MKSEAERFVHVLQQYSHTDHNRRSLYMDRLVREFPYKTRKDLVRKQLFSLPMNSIQSYSGKFWQALNLAK